MTEKERNSGTVRSNPQVGLLLATVFLAYLGQMSLNPIIAPLSREVNLVEWQVGFMVSVAAVMLVLTSQFWGRSAQSWGSKPVLVTALAVATAAMGIFAVLSNLGIRGQLTGWTLFVLFVLARGVLFGIALAAIAPTTQTYITGITRTEDERVKGMAGVGAVQGIAMISGAVVGGLLAAIDLMVTLIAIPILLLIGCLLAAYRLRRESSKELIAKPPRISPRDPRVLPFLLAGFGLFTALGLVQIVTGFLIQDRLSLTANAASLYTGFALLAAGLGVAFAQGVVVARLALPPGKLLLVGVVTGLIGFIALLPDAGIWLIVASMALVGLGIGTALPGYTAGPTLFMNREEQGGLAGLIGATNGLTFVLAPTVGTFLYSIWPLLPILLGVGILFAVLCLVTVHPRFRAKPTAGAAIEG